MNKSKLKRMKRDNEKQRAAIERGYAKALQQSRRWHLLHPSVAVDLKGTGQ